MNRIGVLRAATADDADAVLDVALLSDLAEVGEPNTTIDEIRTDLANNDLGAAVVESDDGELLGYSWVERIPDHGNLFGDIVLRPGAPDDVIDTLFSWLRERAAQVAPDLRIHVFAGAGNTLKRSTYEAAGGTVIRRFYRMSITLDAPPTVPELAPGVAIRTVERTEADLRTMFELVDTAFLDHYNPIREPYDRWLAYSADGHCPDLTLWWIATVDAVPAAGLYSAEMPEAGYIDTLGTLREYRGRGLAKALLLNAFSEFYRRGYRRVALGVDASSPTGAVGLYESVGMSVQHEGLRYELP